MESKKIIGYTISIAEAGFYLFNKNIPDNPTEGWIEELFWDYVEHDQGFPGWWEQTEVPTMEEAKARLRRYASTYIHDEGSRSYFDVTAASLDVHFVNEDDEDEWETLEYAFEEVYDG